MCKDVKILTGFRVALEPDCRQVDEDEWSQSCSGCFLLSITEGGDRSRGASFWGGKPCFAFRSDCLKKKQKHVNLMVWMESVFKGMNVYILQGHRCPSLLFSSRCWHIYLWRWRLHLNSNKTDRVYTGSKIRRSGAIFDDELFKPERIIRRCIILFSCKQPSYTSKHFQQNTQHK